MFDVRWRWTRTPHLPSRSESRPVPAAFIAVANDPEILN